MKQKGFVILPILIIFLLVLGTGFLIYPNFNLNRGGLKFEIPTEFSTSEIPISPSNNFTTTSAFKEGKKECYENNRYFIIVNPENGNFLVKYRTDNKLKYDCMYIKELEDFEIINEWAFFYYGLENNFLLIDAGTGPLPRGLVVYDLEKRLQIYRGSYNTPTNVGNNSIEFWKEVSIKVTNLNCPNKDYWEGGGLGTAIEEYIKLDLITLKENGLNDFRCSPRQ